MHCPCPAPSLLPHHYRFLRSRRSPSASTSTCRPRSPSIGTGCRGPGQSSSMWGKMWCAPTRVRAEESELTLVPSSLAPIVPFLRAAKEIEEDNPRVAYLCRFTAFEKAHTMEPQSSGRGVRQFKTYLLDRLEKDEETKRKLDITDAREIQKFYDHYCTKYLEQDHEKRKPEETARYYQIASILYDVLKTVTPVKHHAKVPVQHVHTAQVTS